jgi:hypothetical protein
MPLSPGLEFLVLPQVKEFRYATRLTRKISTVYSPRWRRQTLPGRWMRRESVCCSINLAKMYMGQEEELMIVPFWIDQSETNVLISYEYK